MSKINIKLLTAVLFVTSMSTIFTLTPASQIKDFTWTAVLPNELIALTNTDREVNQLPSLVNNPLLQRVAQLKANDMAAKGYFSHISPEGKSPWDWFENTNYEFLYAGENLAVNFDESVDVETAWMNSATHRSNILDQEFSEVGIATAKGIYKEKEATFVAQIFAAPMPESKTEYLGYLLRDGDSKLFTTINSPIFQDNGNISLYTAVKRIKTLKENSAPYNRLLNTIILLLSR